MHRSDTLDRYWRQYWPYLSDQPPANNATKPVRMRHHIPHHKDVHIFRLWKKKTAPISNQLCVSAETLNRRCQNRYQENKSWTDKKILERTLRWGDKPPETEKQKSIWKYSRMNSSFLEYNATHENWINYTSACKLILLWEEIRRY